MLQLGLSAPVSPCVRFVLDESGKDTDEDYLGFLRGFWQNVGGDMMAVPSCHSDTPIKYPI